IRRVAMPRPRPRPRLSWQRPGSGIANCCRSHIFRNERVICGPGTSYLALMATCLPPHSCRGHGRARCSFGQTIIDSHGCFAQLGRQSHRGEVFLHARRRATMIGPDAANETYRAASAIAAFDAIQVAFAALVKKGILSKAEAEQILRQAIETIKTGGAGDQAAELLAIALEKISK